jgi:excisionase family DNA binding protein
MSVRRREDVAMVENEHIFTIDELAVYLKISKSTLYKLLPEGKLPGQKVGRHWRFHKKAIDVWLQKYRGKVNF